MRWRQARSPRNCSCRAIHRTAPRTRRIIDGIVVKRIGQPDDVARAALFFLSPDNGFVTGQVLYVCGGATLGLAPV